MQSSDNSEPRRPSGYPVVSPVPDLPRCRARDRVRPAVYRRALEAGATSVRAPDQRDGDEDRRGGVIDTAGNTWWLVTHLGG